MSEIWLRTGEATVLAADGQFTDAMPEVMIGHVKGPVGHAFAAMAGRPPAIRACLSSATSIKWCGRRP